VVTGLIAIVAGVALLAASAAAWTGHWRSWARRFPIGLLSSPLGMFPAAGAVLLVGGLAAADAISETSPLAFVAAVVAIAGLVLSFWSPPWFGPAWYRESPKLTDPDFADAATSAAWAASHRAPAAPATSLDGSEPLEVLSATWFAGDAAAEAMPGLGAGTDVGGKLELHRDGLLFRAGKWDAKARQAATVVEVPAAMIRSARADHGRLVIDTESEAMTFKVFGARGKAAKIQDLYGR
jgi:hypothetical protein